MSTEYLQVQTEIAYETQRRNELQERFVLVEQQLEQIRQSTIEKVRNHCFSMRGYGFMFRFQPWLSEISVTWVPLMVL
jgi:ABC-type bacteriocin/lantibiotic exporter with double-glycine peptidase domain